jgi:hypothetical protein
MKLRDHPLMSCHGASNWPPVWTQASTGRRPPKIVRDEVGILRYVHAYDNPASDKCYLLIDYEGEHYLGALLFDDATFCHQLTALLRHHIGRPIEEIGDLDVGFML